MTDPLERLGRLSEEATPGPWVVDGLYVKTRETHGLSGHWLVAKMCGSASNPSVAADARLIAAVPDLLAAVRAAEDVNYLIAHDAPRGSIDEAQALLDTALDNLYQGLGGCG